MSKKPQVVIGLGRPLALVAVIALVVGACQPTPSVMPTTRANPGPSPSATAAPSVAAPSASLGIPSPSVGPTLPPTSWDQVFTLEHGALSDAIAWRGRLIATGCVPEVDSDCGQRIVVTSLDGATWNVVDVDIAGNLSFGSLHRVGDRLFALGYASARKYGGATVLTSLDGNTWTRVRSASLRARAIHDLIRTPLGTFAIGYEAPPDSDNTSGFVIWPVRADGSFGSARVVDTGGDPRLVIGAIWTGDEFLAWGLRNGPYTGPTIILASPDGVEWAVRGRVPGRRATVVEDIVAVGDRLVAVGYEGRRFPLTPRAWTSDDAGRSWALADVPGDDARMATVDVEDGGLIARGTESFDANQRPASWVSTDGSAWTRLADDEDVPLVAGFRGLTPATIGDRTCVAGWFYEGTPVGAAIYCH